MLIKTCRLEAHVGKNRIFRSKKGRNKKKQEVHCKTGLNLVFKMATKMTAVWHYIHNGHHDNKEKKVNTSFLLLGLILSKLHLSTPKLLTKGKKEKERKKLS